MTREVQLKPDVDVATQNITLIRDESTNVTVLTMPTKPIVMTISIREDADALVQSSGVGSVLVKAGQLWPLREGLTYKYNVWEVLDGGGHMLLVRGNCLVGRSIAVMDSDTPTSAEVKVYQNEAEAARDAARVAQAAAEDEALRSAAFATQSEEAADQAACYRDQIVLAGEVLVGPPRFYDTYEEAYCDLNSVAEGDIIEIHKDENVGHLRTRYRIEDGLLAGPKVVFSPSGIEFADRFTLETATMGYGFLCPGEKISTKDGLLYRVAMESVTDAHLTTAGGAKLYEAGYYFTTLDRFRAAIARGDFYSNGDTVTAGGAFYLKLGNGNTNIAGLTGWTLAQASDTEPRLVTVEADAVETEARLSNLEEILTEGATYAAGGPVRAATTGNVALTGDINPVDGVTLVTGDRYLARAQTDPAENGFYVFHADLAHLRADDMDEAAEVQGTLVQVEEGDTYAGTVHYTGSLVEQLGVDAISWVVARSDTSALSAAYLSHSVERTLFVSQGGSDTNNGENLTKAVRSIEKALEIAGNTTDPVAVWVHPGTYLTAGHLDVPDNVTGVVAATNTRSTKIRPSTGNEQKNVFRLGDGGYIEGFSFEGWQVDSLTDPTEGFAVSFRPGATIYRAPFAFNITVYRRDPPNLIPPPVDRRNGNPLVGNGPGVALADRAVVSQYSVFPQMMLWGATPVCPNGIGYCAKNGAFLNGINAVALWMHKHYLALSGGKIYLTNCASQFGDYTLWAEGSTFEVIPGVTSATLVSNSPASNAIRVNATDVIDLMWGDLVLAGYGSVDEAATRKDAAILLRALEFDLRAGQQDSTRLFARGLFDYAGDFVSPASTIPAFNAAFDAIAVHLNARCEFSPEVDAMVLGLIQIVKDTIANPQKRVKPSEITSVGHQWNNTMAGVNRRALFQATTDVVDSIVEKDLGTVRSSGVDDIGKQYFMGGLVINPLTGKLEGPPVGPTIDPRARRQALIAGGQL